MPQGINLILTCASSDLQQARAPRAIAKVTHRYGEVAPHTRILVTRFLKDLHQVMTKSVSRSLSFCDVMMLDNSYADCHRQHSSEPALTSPDILWCFLFESDHRRGEKIRRRWQYDQRKKKELRN